MAVMTLTIAQERAVAAVVAARRLERGPGGQRRCGGVPGQAETAARGQADGTH